MADWTEWERVEAFDFEDIIYEKRYRERGGGVARLLMDRPQSMNAMTGNGWQEIVDAMRDAAADNTIGVIVLSQTGPHFGVGGDMQWEAEGGLRGAIPNFDGAIKGAKKPVVAAVRGYCIGGHNHMAYTCDFTIAGESAIFGQTGPRVGSPASGFTVASSAHVVGQKRGRELWMRCRQFTAQEALAMGLCNVVVQDRLIDREVERWCDEILDLVPYCLAAVKQSFEAVDMPLHYSGNFLNMIEPNFHDRPEVKEAQRAFFEQRKPNFWQDEMVAQRRL